MVVTRRDFLSQSRSVPLAFFSLEKLFSLDRVRVTPGELALKKDPFGILDLPEGFTYRVIARSGEEMSDGLLRPWKPDGMAAFAGENGAVHLICNHEVYYARPEMGAFGANYERLEKIDAQQLVRRFADGRPFLGGTTTLVYDPQSQKVEKSFLSMGGTERNCAGGHTPRGTWISCEEPESLTRSGFEQELGYCYEVEVSAEAALQKPIPIKGMGRFRHEAVAVDPRDGVVYLSEDRGEGLLYRYLPDNPKSLAAGGRLQALAVQGELGKDLRNWKDGKEPIQLREKLPVEWVDLEEIDAPLDDLRFRGRNEKGAACFARTEGMWFGSDEVFFTCTNGGVDRIGQIWRLHLPDKGQAQLELFVEPNDRRILQGCDNLTVSPQGELIVCEDGRGQQYLRRVSQEGVVTTFARNVLSNGEFAGACFAPHLPILFVNLQSDGLTLAIEGDWDSLS